MDIVKVATSLKKKKKGTLFSLYIIFIKTMFSYTSGKWVNIISSKGKTHISNGSMSKSSSFFWWWSSFEYIAKYFYTPNDIHTKNDA